MENVVSNKHENNAGVHPALSLGKQLANDAKSMLGIWDNNDFHIEISEEFPLVVAWKWTCKLQLWPPPFFQSIHMNFKTKSLVIRCHLYDLALLTRFLSHAGVG